MSDTETKARLEGHFKTSIYKWRIKSVTTATNIWNSASKREEWLCEQVRSGYFLVHDEPRTSTQRTIWLARKGKKK